MCGISGIISQKTFKLIDLKKMTDVIRHRGPDGEGYVGFGINGAVNVAGGEDTVAEVWNHQSPYQPVRNITEIEDECKVGFGHRRLSILDLSACGHQPMSYAKQRYWITFNGEIYNYRELQQELASLGHDFHSHSDTEVILAAYKEWGAACLDHFSGMWAFAIYDVLNQELFLARDRFGIKPLYYWFSPEGSFAFASEIKQFTTLPGWAAKINPQRAYDYLVYSITDHTEETMFDGVFQVPGGHYFKARIKDLAPLAQRKIKTQKWYDLTYRQYSGTFDEAAAGFNRLFKKAVDLHLRSDVPVGSALSGGLDSSAIVCEVNNILKSQGAEGLQKTFSSCATDERYTEKKWVDIVVEQTKVDAHYVYPKPEEVFTLMSELTWLHDEPYQSQSAFLGYHVFKLAAANGVKVLLNGQGADEYLGGYGQFTTSRYHEKFKKLDWLGLLKDLRLSGRYNPVSYKSFFKNLLYSFAPSALRKKLANSLGSYNQIKTLINNKALKASSLHPFEAIPVQQTSVQEVSKHFTFYSTLPKYLKWEDRNSMASSVEARVPFLDHNLVEFTYNLPDDYLEFGGETKRVLRYGLEDILPEKIRNRKDKKGFITPEERWVKEDNPELFRIKIKDEIELSNGIINPAALQYFDDIVSSKIPFDYTYWRIIQFGDWMRVFNLSN
jgi:asparagine synthase (glutamine-hydrolysing)